jgi:hypothetical protein
MGTDEFVLSSDESLRYGVQLSTSGLNHSLQSGTNEGKTSHVLFIQSFA